jgi:hypothetical protein
MRLTKAQKLQVRKELREMAQALEKETPRPEELTENRKRELEESQRALESAAVRCAAAGKEMGLQLLQKGKRR